MILPRSFYLCAALIAFLFLSVVWLEPETFYQMAAEDGLIENVGALCFFAASLFFLRLYLRADGPHHFFVFSTRKNCYFLILSMLFLICFGEEISWGQRIFDWKSPAFFLEINMQRETNLHNLSFFHALGRGGAQKSFWEKMLSMNRLFSIFWFIYCLALPMLDRFSVRAQQLLTNAGIPVPAIWTGALFLVTYIVFRYSVYGENPEFSKALDELKEACYAALFLVVAIEFYLRKRQLQTKSSVQKK